MPIHKWDCPQRHHGGPRSVASSMGRLLMGLTRDDSRDHQSVVGQHFRYHGAMTPFSESTRHEKLIEVSRWICVLPAAVLGNIVAQFVVGVVVQIAGHGEWDILGDSSVAYYLRFILYYMPRKMAFVLAGAKMAPRHQMTTGIFLAMLGILLSLITHVLGQHLVGNHVGLVNFTHFFAESTGALGGTACIFLQNWKKRRTAVAA
jgi:hypothetical protein